MPDVSAPFWILAIRPNINTPRKVLIGRKSRLTDVFGRARGADDEVILHFRVPKVGDIYYYHRDVLHGVRRRLRDVKYARDSRVISRSFARSK